MLLEVSSNGGAPGDAFFILQLSFLTGFVEAIADTNLGTVYYIFRRKEEKQGTQQDS